MRIFLVFILIISHFDIYSQESKDQVKLWSIYPGYIITWENDTVHGFIKLNNLVDNQRKAIFYKNEGDDKPFEKYKPKEIKAYKVGPRFYESYKIRVTNESKGYHFFLKIFEGPISYYKWFYEPKDRQQQRLQLDEDDIANSKIDLSFSEDDLENYDFAKKLNGEFTNLSSLKYLTNFKKRMSAYVSDYPNLAEKIANKEEGYRYYDKEKIIQMYNEWYLKNRKNE